MPDHQTNVTLIGMPGAGKTTVGQALAGLLGWHFLDTDHLMESEQNRPLRDIMESEGLEGFRRLENDLVAGLRCTHTVIATGGSVVYGEQAMSRLRELGPVFYLEAPLAVLAERVTDIPGRGMVIRPDQSFAHLFEERCPLYRRFANRVVEIAGKTPRQIAGEIERMLQEEWLRAEPRGGRRDGSD